MGFPPASHQTATNRADRLNSEIKRRTEVIGVFPNEDAIIHHPHGRYHPCLSRTTNGWYSAPAI
jgi:transposase-like protein